MYRYFLILALLFMTLFSTLNGFAQTSGDSTEVKPKKERKKSANQLPKRSNKGDKKYAFRIDPLYLLMRQPYFYYEDVLTERSSLQWEGSFQVPWQIKSDLYAPIINAQDTNFNSKPANLTGFSLGLAYKYYTTYKKRPALKGAYLAPYFRYSNYTLNFPKVVTMGPQSPITWKVNATLEGWRLGAMVGWQWALDNGFTIDWMLMGISYGPYIITSRFTTEDEAQFQQIKDMSATLVNEIEDRFTNVQIRLGDAQGKVRGEFWTAMPRVQPGITIGYSFN